MIEQLPEGWQLVKFSDIANNISKRVEPAETELEKYVGLEHLEPDSLKIMRNGVPSDVKGQKLLVKKGQIIFGKRRAYQRKVAVADWDCICSAHAMVLEAKVGKVIPSFLPYFLQSDAFMNRAIAISEGSLSPTIKWKVLANQSFAIPAEIEQEKLLKILNKTQRNIEDVHQCIVSLNKVKLALRGKLFNSLEFTTIDEVAKVKTGATPRRNIESYWGGAVNWMASGEVHQKFLSKTAEKITEKGVKNSNTTLLPIDTVVLAMNGQGKTRGCVAITQIETTCNQSIAAIICNSELINPLYLMFFLDGKYEEIRSLTGEGRNGLNLKLVKGIKVPKIPIKEQDQIAEVFLDLYHSEMTLKEKASNLQQLMRKITTQ